MILSLLKNKLSEYVDKNEFGDILYYRIKYAMGTALGKIFGEEKYADWFYHLYTGRHLDLNNPLRYDEKLWWIKLNYRDDLMTTCTDKLKVRYYVKKKGYNSTLIPLLDVYDDIRELDLEKYQTEVVVKCNHTSGGHLFYDPEQPLTKKEEVYGRKRINFLMHRNQYVLSREWNYKGIKPKIIVEKVIRDRQGKLPLDYKFMCFHGVPKLLFLDIGVMNQDDSYNHDYPRNIYDMDFKLMPFKETRPNSGRIIEKPENFDFMVKMARELSQPFPHCRVDLYNVDGKVLFGEITFFHGGGCNQFYPDEWDYKIGEWIDLNAIGKEPKRS